MSFLVGKPNQPAIYNKLVFPLVGGSGAKEEKAALIWIFEAVKACFRRKSVKKEERQTSCFTPDYKASCEEALRYTSLKLMADIRKH